MKRVEIQLPLALLHDLGILSARFFRNNASVTVVQSFAIGPRVAALVLRVRRHGPFKDPATVEREARAIARRYHLERFEVLSYAPDRGEYLAWVEWVVPEGLRRLLADESGGIVPLEVGRVTPKDARVTLLAPDGMLPRVRRFLDELGVPYRVRAVRTVSAGGWEPLSELTQRQRAILELAFRLGYYESPAMVSLSQIGRILGISRAAVSKHLRGAERKLLASVVAGPH